jgi:hypothetical protein
MRRRGVIIAAATVAALLMATGPAMATDPPPDVWDIPDQVANALGAFMQQLGENLPFRDIFDRIPGFGD